MTDIHSCSYYCDQPECIKAQRDELRDKLAQPEQEPVACERCKQLEEHAYDLVGELRVANIKLSMRPQRTWVGLTDQEIRDWWRIENGLEDCNMAKLVDFTLAVRAIEAKLKEKNT